MTNCAESAIRHFQIEGTPVSCSEFGGGHINLTCKVKTDSGKSYILQRINRYVFTNPKAVMENVGAVTEYLRTRVSNQSEILHFVLSDAGTYYYVDEGGEYWRCYEFADGLCLDLPETDKDFYESAIAFGRFQEMLRDFPAETLHETIPLFHNTANRYRQLRAAIEADRVGRVDGVKDELDFLLAREHEGETICRLLDNGELPLRVTHNDTKLNNVLLDPETREALCVLDLDTVGPKGTPGEGSTVVGCKGKRIGVINIMGRVNILNIDCPFAAVTAEIERLKDKTDIIIVDFHADATSEKRAMGFYLDGKATCVFGTHTHVQTADECLLPRGTAYITDLGMTGAEQSVIGVLPEAAISKFVTALPTKFEHAHGKARMCGAVLTVDDETCKALSLKRIVKR